MIKFSQIMPIEMLLVFVFFKYIYDNLATSNELFDIYNKFYCAVSGSIVSPDRPDNYNIIKVKNNDDNKCIFGKYYRCCTPCNCDIMKYATVVKTSIEIPKNSGKFYEKNLLTIGDPCIKDGTEFPNEIDKEVFKCKNNLLINGYRVNNNKLTSGPGRLVIGVLYPIEHGEEADVKESLNICLTGTKRLLSPPEKLQYGMGDIFVKMALMNDDKQYNHSEEDLCN